MGLGKRGANEMIFLRGGCCESNHCSRAFRIEETDCGIVTGAHGAAANDSGLLELTMACLPHLWLGQYTKSDNTVLSNQLGG